MYRAYLPRLGKETKVVVYFLGDSNMFDLLKDILGENSAQIWLSLSIFKDSPNCLRAVLE